ncbi:MAG: glycerol-3-phosphate 1-O-acyltransferase PlsY [Chloroflexi bacterium]|nr:glycerol-3-phosphate 1-O-acyltransferase PlsY [Chloroflexota bacterium]
MNDPWGWLIAIPAAYVLGSLPFGVIIGRLFSDVDVRSAGSGSVGASNVMRTSGVKAGVLALILDGAKGAVAIGIAKFVADGPTPELEAIAGLTAMVGHNWSIFIGFKGGKGVTTGWAALGVMSPWAALATLTGAPVAAASRYVSLGSIVGASTGLIVLAVQVLVFDYGGNGYLIYAAGGLVLIFWRHLPNIGRIIRGEENKIGQRVELHPPPASSA